MIGCNVTSRDMKAAVSAVFEPDVSFVGTVQPDGCAIYVALGRQAARRLLARGLPAAVDAAGLDRLLLDPRRNGLCIEVVEPRCRPGNAPNRGDRRP